MVVAAHMKFITGFKGSTKWDRMKGCVWKGSGNTEAALNSEDMRVRGLRAPKRPVRYDSPEPMPVRRRRRKQTNLDDISVTSAKALEEIIPPVPHAAVRPGLSAEVSAELSPQTPTTKVGRWLRNQPSPKTSATRVLLANKNVEHSDQPQRHDLSDSGVLTGDSARCANETLPAGKPRPKGRKPRDKAETSVLQNSTGSVERSPGFLTQKTKANIYEKVKPDPRAEEENLAENMKPRPKMVRVDYDKSRLKIADAEELKVAQEMGKAYAERTNIQKDLEDTETVLQAKSARKPNKGGRKNANILPKSTAQKQATFDAEMTVNEFPDTTIRKTFSLEADTQDLAHIAVNEEDSFEKKIHVIAEANKSNKTPTENVDKAKTLLTSTPIERKSTATPSRDMLEIDNDNNVDLIEQFKLFLDENSGKNIRHTEFRNVRLFFIANIESSTGESLRGKRVFVELDPSSMAKEVRVQQNPDPGNEPRACNCKCTCIEKKLQPAAGKGDTSGDDSDQSMAVNYVPSYIGPASSAARKRLNQLMVANEQPKCSQPITNSGKVDGKEIPTEKTTLPVNSQETQQSAMDTMDTFNTAVESFGDNSQRPNIRFDPNNKRTFRRIKAPTDSSEDFLPNRMSDNEDPDSLNILFNKHCRIGSSSPSEGFKMSVPFQAGQSRGHLPQCEARRISEKCIDSQRNVALKASTVAHCDLGDEDNDVTHFDDFLEQCGQTAYEGDDDNDSDNIVKQTPEATEQLVNPQTARRGLIRPPPPMSRLPEESARMGVAAGIDLVKGDIVDAFPEAVCVVSSGLSTEETRLLLQMIKMVGATHDVEFSTRTTHLVAFTSEDGAASRTVKVMMAIAMGAWVVSMAWVRACIAAKRLVLGTPYEMKDSIFGDSARRSRLGSNRLFKDFAFFLMPPYTGQVVVSSFKLILEYAGGTLVNDASDKGGKKYLITLSEMPNQPLIYEAYMDKYKILMLSYSWIYMGICSYKLRPVWTHLPVDTTLKPFIRSSYPSQMFDDSTTSDEESQGSDDEH